MNSLSAIASAIAEGASQLEPGRLLHIPLDEQRSVRLQRAGRGAGIVATVAQRPVGRSEAQEDADREALLRLGADTRWTAGLTGGLDEEGWDCVSLALADTGDAARVESALADLLARLPAAAPAAVHATAAGGLPPAWLRA